MSDVPTSNSPTDKPVTVSGDSSTHPAPASRVPLLLRIGIGTLVFGVALFWGLNYLAENWARESTDDAFIDGHVVAIASKVAGEVLETHVVENQEVKAGEPLLEIDPRDYEVRLRQKRAALESSLANQRAFQAGFELMRTRVKTAEAAKKQSEAEAQASKSTFDNAESYWKRAEQLWTHSGSQAISEQTYDSAKASMLSAQANWQASLEKVATDDSRVTESHAQLTAAEKLYEQTGAQVNQAEAEVKSAELQLEYTKITAPVDGRITRKMVEKGSFIQIGQSLMAIVRPELWVTANFKETQTAYIRPGQSAEIEIDGSTNRTLRGHVDSLQSGSGARFSMLPPENAVGNYVKVVQRVPVKIAFDNPVFAGGGLGPGMSAVPSVQIGVRPVSTAWVAVASLVIALLAGTLIGLLTRRPANV